MQTIRSKLNHRISIFFKTKTILRFPVFGNKEVQAQEFVFHKLSEKNCCSETQSKMTQFLDAMQYAKKTYKEEIGKSTWMLLHGIAENYPESPTTSDKENVKQFINLLSRLYPCEDCKESFQQIVKENPPNVSNRLGFCRYVCKIHNIVNQKIGKNKVDCKKLYQK